MTLAVTAPVQSQPRRCSICDGEKAGVINALLAAGRTPNAIEVEMKALGSPTKSETVTKHRDVCLKDVDGVPIMANGDFAQIVQREAIKLAQQGQLHIRTADGLQAQTILDRRAEKVADRGLAMNLARLLSGAEDPTPPEVIVGEFEVLTGDPDDAPVPDPE